MVGKFIAGDFIAIAGERRINYPEFLVANLNYAGGHAGHQIYILVAKNEI